MEVEHGIPAYCSKHKPMKAHTPPNGIEVENPKQRADQRTKRMVRDLEVGLEGLRPEAGHPGSPS